MIERRVDCGDERPRARAVAYACVFGGVASQGKVDIRGNPE